MAERSGVSLNLVLLAGLGVGGYLLYRALTSAGSKAVAATQQAFSNTSSGVADVLETLFPHAIGNTVLAAGATILLGDGTEIPAASAQGVGAFTDTDNTVKFQFFYQGKMYRTTSGQPDSTNTYYAASTTG